MKKILQSATRVPSLLLFVFSLVIFTFHTNAGTVPIITADPQNSTTKLNDTAVFSVTATGDSLKYKWQTVDSVGALKAITGADSSTYKRRARLADNGLKFCCVVSNPAGSDTSAIATLTVPPPPTIVKQPVNDSSKVGETITFTVSATSTNPPMTFQWQQNRGSMQWVNVEAATDTFLSLTSVVDTMHRMSFRCAVTDQNGTMNSSPAQIILLAETAPVIVTEPLDKVATEGDSNVTFSPVIATGQFKQFKWLKDSAGTITNSSATDSIYKFGGGMSKVKMTDHGKKFCCIVYNNAGSDTSRWALLTVTTSGIINQFITTKPQQFSVTPNVVRSSTNLLFAFNTTGTTPVTLSIYNQLGQVIFSESWIAKGQGNNLIANQFMWNLKSSAGTQVSSGSYVAVLSIKNSSNQRIEKTKFKIIQ
ncbi:MAG: hypothetical protein JW795_18450 [Chitinivibrionales bacterium]|nr:hypothetical protein [Chitinivibrionales bacterium]